MEVSMSNRLLAIDIQEDQISSVLLTHSLKGIRIVETACYKIVQETEGDNPLQAVQDTLKKILVKMGDVDGRCIVGIPSHYFFIRTLELPFKNKKKNSLILPFELENYLPCQVEDVEFDFLLLDKNSKNSSKTNMAWVAGIQNDVLEKFKKLFDDCDIHPDVVTPGSGYSAAVVYAGAADPSGFLFVMHVEHGRVSVYAARFGEIAFSRIFVFNSDDPIQSVKTNLIHTLLSFNEVFSNSLELNEIIVSGSAPFMPELCEDIEKEMKVQVHFFDIFKIEKIIPVSGQPGEHQYDSIQNVIAMGVNDIKGVETYNFTRQVSDFTLFYHENRFNVLVLAIMSFFLFLAWAIHPVIQINRMEREIEQIDARITQVFNSCFPEVTTIVDPVHQMQVQVDALQEKRISNFFDESLLCIDLLNEISKSLPSSLDIVFSRFVRTENNLLISGSADQFITIDKMKNYFKNIEFFKEVDINSASMDKVEKRVIFNLKVLL
jgi:general secretion pathway protein L